MENYSNFPPIKLFKKVLRLSPISSELYISLWEEKTPKNQLLVEKLLIKNKYLISTTVFRKHLITLSKLEIISFEEKSSFFVVTLHE